MISIEEFVERLCRVGAGAPRPFPRKRRDREILLKSLTMEFESTRTYTESEINAGIESWLRDVAPAIETDHVTLRRLLVDAGLLERRADGTAYQIGFPPGPVAFALDVDDLDQRGTVARYRDAERQRRRRTAREPGASEPPRGSGDGAAR